MTLLDLLILGALAAGIVHGFSTGLIRQVSSIFGMLVAFLLGIQLMQVVGGVIVDSLGLSASLAPLLGFVAAFLVVQIVVITLTKMVEKLVGALKLTGVNRLLGGAAGAFKASLLLSVAFMILARFGVPGATTIADSSLYDPVATVLPASWDYVAERFPDVQSISERFGEQVQDHLPGTGP